LLLLSASSVDAQRSVGLQEIDRALDDIERVIDDAYFHTALGLADTRREWLAELDPRPGLASRRARLEVLAATAEVALGRRAQAAESMRRALMSDPSMSLEASQTPPKVLALLREARADDMPGSTP
jgi:hypothetical protein